MKAHIVVGANFGDEGKGQITDYLARTLDNNIVVRHNGGAQAAHTVVMDDGTRHVFHHFGSGTLRGSPTFLSEYFISNPRVFIEEALELKHLGVADIRVLAHSDSLLTTPYDWLLNWRREEMNGHGSCGMGINETVERSFTVPTTIEDLYDIDLLEAKLENIRKIYVPKRAKEIGIDVSNVSNPWMEDTWMEEFIEDCKIMAQVITPVNDYNVLNTFDNVIFEGAQGLLLDEYHRFFPHVTRSRTGSSNAARILEELGNDEVANLYYVTRTYLTRHGAGPLPGEGEIEPKHDITNQPNQFQGPLRFAPLDLDLLEETVWDDLYLHHEDLVNPYIMVTWGNEPEGEGLREKLYEILPFPQIWFNDPTSNPCTSES